MTDNPAHKPLSQLSDSEWEALCDGCAKCCLHKLEDAEDGQVYFTKVRCRYLDEHSCRCSDYANRSRLVPNCIDLRGRDPATLEWLPSTCAYRLRANGQPLPSWHYLVCGDREAVHRAGVSIRGRSVSDEFVHPDGYDEHVVHWVE
ncbi:MAG: YcgN family cysteine cluster protein [Halioglobus sp.]|nr:YcgN family cysteine cluster protein [Halioglobus sp.]